MHAWLEIGLSNAAAALLLAGVAWLVGRYCRNPQFMFALWVLVLVKLVTPPVVGIPWAGWQAAAIVETPTRADPGKPGATAVAAAAVDPAERAGEVATVSAAEARAGSLALPSGMTLLASLWLGGTAVWLALAGVRIARFRRTLARTPLAGEALSAEVARLARQMGLRRAPQVRVVGAALPPLVWALSRRPAIVLPAGLLARLSAEQTATLLAHELAHLKRRDHLVRLLEMAALAVYWWNPAAWWARRQIARAGEACCDAEVLAQFPERARDYAETLVAAVEYLSDARPALPAGSSGMSQVPILRRRLEMILSGTAVRRVNWPLRLALVALAILALPPGVRSVSAEPKSEVKAFVPKAGSIEERLDRLEKALQVLTQELRAVHDTQKENLEPVVIKTVPENGATDVDPNLTEIKVTFNKDMADGSWSWTQRSDDTFPEVNGKIHYEADKRTCVLPVKLEPGKTYYIGINSRSHRNFKDARLHPAIPYPLSFKTKE